MAIQPTDKILAIVSTRRLVSGCNARQMTPGSHFISQLGDFGASNASTLYEVPGSNHMGSFNAIGLQLELEAGLQPPDEKRPLGIVRCSPLLYLLCILLFRVD